MNRLKIGREGWLEEGMQEGILKGRQEVALRMLEEGMSVAAICRITKLSRNAVSKLGRENSEPRGAKKQA